MESTKDGSFENIDARMGDNVGFTNGRDQWRLNDGYSDSRMYNRRNLVFALVSMSLVATTNTSIESLFHYPGLVKRCVTAHLVCRLISGLATLLFVPVSLDILPGLCLYMLLCKFMILFIVAIGDSISCGYSLIGFYGLNGFLEVMTIQACTVVISRHFSKPSIVTLYSGYPGGFIFISLLQLLFEHFVGARTAEKMRLCTVVLHAIQVLVAFIAAAWVSYLHSEYEPMREDAMVTIRRTDGMDDGSSGVRNGDRREHRPDHSDHPSTHSIENIIVTHSRDLHSFISATRVSGTILRELLHPYLVPLLLDLPPDAKLTCAISSNVSELIGIICSCGDERVDHKSPLTMSSFFYISAIVVTGISTFITWHSKSSLILLMTLINGLVRGILTGRGMNGCPLQHKQKDGEGRPIVGDDIVKPVNIINDISFDYAVAAVVSALSSTTKELMARQKDVEMCMSSKIKENFVKSIHGLIMQSRSGYLMHTRSLSKERVM